MKKILLSSVFIAVSGAVFAQAVVPGVIDRDQPSRDIPQAFKDAPDNSAVDNVPTLRATQNDRVIGTFSNIAYEGPTVLSAATIDEVTAPYVNRELTVSDIAELNYAIEKLYYTKGFLLVKAVVPVDQDLDSGTLIVKVHEARIGDIIPKDVNEILNGNVKSGIIKYGPQGDVFNKNISEKVLNDYNDLYGVAASAALTPGSRYKTTDLVIALDEIDEDYNIISLDNYGSEYTGEYVAGVHLEKDNFFGQGERLTADFRASDEALYSYAVGAEVPIGIDNIAIKARFSHTDSDIANEFEAVGLEGQSDVARIVVNSRPVNNDAYELNIYGGFEYRLHESESNTGRISKDDMRKAVFGSNLSHRGDKHFAYGDLALSQGVDVFGASDYGDADNSRANGDQETLLINPTALLYYYPNAEGRLKLLGRGQYATTKVLASDAYAIGGYGSVRGFDVAQEIAEHGAAFTAEYMHDVNAVASVGARIGAFADYGFVRAREGEIDDDELFALGVAVELDAEISETNPTTLRLDYAWPVGDYTDPDVDEDGTFYFRVAQYF